VPWAVGYLLPQTGRRSLAFAALAGYSSYPLFTVLVLAWALRRWSALAACVLLLTGQVATLGPLYVGDGEPSAVRPRLRVMTANLLFGTADMAQVVRIVRAQHVDVLALEELTPGAVAELDRAGLRSALPYAITRAATGPQGTGLWSRYPVTDLPVRQLRFHSVAAAVHIGDRSVVVRAEHPVPPFTPSHWRRDLALLRADLATDATAPTVILGDLNSSVHHRELRRLMGGRWRDAAEAEGAGLVRTWTPRLGAPSVLEPDHVLVDRGMTVARYETVRIRHSDHRAVLVEVALAGSG
jgi:endonuclease/exonuclease/phosphatase (EEP) superfamily protein YafD